VHYLCDYVHIHERIRSVLGLPVGVCRCGECVWVRKSVPTATTRRERLEGESTSIGVGIGRRTERPRKRGNSDTQARDLQDTSSYYSLSPEFVEEIVLCGPSLRARNISSHLSHSAAGVFTAS
jgi:hypothetical protein